LSVLKWFHPAGEVFDSLTSAAASIITGPGTYTSMTNFSGLISSLVGGSIFSEATSVVGGAVSHATSAIAGVGGSIFTEVTCAFSFLRSDQSLFELIAAGGRAFTVITSEGGQALTLAESGIPTSAFGSVYTVATAAILPSTASSAAGLHAVTAPTIIGLVAVLGSMLLGAVVTF